MKKVYFLALSFFCSIQLISQALYFPPVTGGDWEKLDPSELNWCQEKINVLYDFLAEKNSRAFLLLKDGKIVLEQYFNGHGPDSLWYWASAGKTVTATLTGIAQEEGLLNINDPTSDYLGEGWTSAPADKEELITVWHQLTMTAGLDDGVMDPYCTDPECLIYLQDAGSRWAYHNGPYTNLSRVVEMASGQDYNIFYWQRLANKIGMGGIWIYSGYNRLLFSKPRAMARFGLLMQNDGQWDDTPVLNNLDYINSMRSTSQDLNKAYGYLWWLNGKASYQLPGLQFEFQGPISPNAPEDTYSAMGKNGQFLSVIPSEGMVMVRMGEAPDNSLVPIVFYNEIWDYLNDMECEVSGVGNEIASVNLLVYPNPVGDVLYLDLKEGEKINAVKIFDSFGKLVSKDLNDLNKIDLVHLKSGIYILQITLDDKIIQKKIIKK